MRKDVDRHINALVETVCKIHRLFKFLLAKVAAERTKTECLAAEIGSIRTVEKCHLQFFHRAGRREKFRFFPHNLPFEGHSIDLLCRATALNDIR